MAVLPHHSLTCIYIIRISIYPSTMYRTLHPIHCIVLYRYIASGSTSCACIYNT